MVALVGATLSFKQGDEFLRELAGIHLGAKMVERSAEALGRDFDALEKALVEPEASRTVPPTLYLGMDGTGVPMRASEVAGRRGKQEDGSAATREAKLCVLFSAEARDQDGVPMRDLGSATYSAAIESAASNDTDDSPSEFAQRVCREASRRRFHQAGRRVVIGDGAAWIWNLADEHFPGAIQILDRFHAKEHLRTAGRELWGGDNDLYRHWLSQRDAELDAGNIELLVEKLKIHAANSEEVARCAQYFLNNRHRARYAAFHAVGLCTSTGIVEAACKTLVAHRLKCAGMHWSVTGANAIIALRATKLSDRLDDYLLRRSLNRKTA